MGLFRWKQEPAAPEEDRQLRPGERLERDLGKFLLASIFAFLGVIPFALGISFAVVTHSVLPLLLAGGLGGMLAVPQLCGLVDTILRSLRDEAGIWWYVYRRNWKRNLRASLLPGAVFGLIFAMQIFVVAHVGLMDFPVFQLATLCLTSLLLLGIAAYFFPMLVLLELPFGAMLKNSLLLFLRHLPRSLLAASILFVFAAFLLLWFPISTVVLLVGGFWVPILLACRIIYPILDKEFELTAAIAALQERPEEE